MDRSRFGTHDDNRRQAAMRAVYVAIEMAEAALGRGRLLSLRDIRSTVGLSKEDFDRAVLALSAARRVHLFPHDYPSGLPAAEREALVHDPRGAGRWGRDVPAGAYYNVVALR